LRRREVVDDQLKGVLVTMHTDIPTHAQIEQLLDHRAPSSVSIYLPTDRVATRSGANQLTFAGLAEVAIEQLRNGGAPGDDIAAVQEAVQALIEDDAFWTRQSDSLAVFMTPDSIKAFRLPNQLGETVQVSDRFHVKPLLRAVTFPQAAYVLALAKGEVRLLEISAGEAPEEVSVADLPRDAWDPRGNKVFMARDRNYVRQVDHALRSVLNGSDLPLILAATEGIAALYRTVNTYPHLAATRWPGNPEESSDADLATAVRTILDEVYAAQLADTAALFDQRASQGRAATDVSDIARLATMGAVDTLLVDIDGVVPGSIDEHTGAVTFTDEQDATTYGVIDEIARRVYLANGRVLAVRGDDIPGGGPAAAILRYVV
jgi:hypothetical protein